MSQSPILFVGGSGTVGREATRWFRQARPDVPILVGGRDLAKARDVAQELGRADAVRVDLAAPGLGLEPERPLAAIVMLAPDESLRGVRLALERRIPYLGIHNGVTELGVEMALAAHRHDPPPLLVASHWMAGAALFLALEAARRLTVVGAAHLGALHDEEDAAGPAALEDMQRVHGGATLAMAFRDRRRLWLSGEESRGSIRLVDGREVEAKAFSSPDILSLVAALDVPDIRFDLASGLSSSRCGSGPPASEIVVELSGDLRGAPGRIRATLVFSRGGASLTGLCASLLLTALVEPRAVDEPLSGLVLPELVLRPREALDALEAAGARISIAEA